MPRVSDAQRKASAKHDKEHFQYITFKARRGSRDRLLEAATSAGTPLNRFIRDALNKAVEAQTGRPMEAVEQDTQDGGVE